MSLPGRVEVSGTPATGLVISVPHSGEEVPPEIEARLACSPRQVRPETDEFSLDLARAGEPWGTLVRARAARLVIDVNRSGTVSPIDLSDDPA
ncbi:MAG: N-formylglutamate amidohydrolase, partial [Gemmatimonadota bacterium]